MRGLLMIQRCSMHRTFIWKTHVSLVLVQRSPQMREYCGELHPSEAVHSTPLSPTV
jgi:hypothetical protein